MKMPPFGFYRAGRPRMFLVVVSLAAGCFIAGPSRAETLKGSIRYVGAPIEKKKTPVTIDQYVCGKEKEPEDLLLFSNSGIRNAIVSLQNVPAGAKHDWNFPAAKMDQKQCSFTPRVVIVPVGGTVEFLKIRLCAADELERRGAILCGNNFVVRRCQRPLKERQILLVIVNRQNAGKSAHVHPPSKIYCSG